ncbi:MAG TPA: energy transducer TonB [Lacunisphaera sp.]
MMSSLTRSLWFVWPLLGTALAAGPDAEDNLRWHRYAAPVFPIEISQTTVRDGFATVAFTFDDDGRITDQVVLAASHPLFAEAVRSAVAQWQLDTRTLPATERRDTRRFDFLRNGSIVGMSQRDALKSALDPFGDLAADPIVTLKESVLSAPLKNPAGGQPEFPKELSGRIREGMATVEFVVDAEGRVRVPAVTSASHPAFGAAALASVRAWRFAPPQHQGRSVQIMTERTVRFLAQ